MSYFDYLRIQYAVGDCEKSTEQLYGDWLDAEWTHFVRLMGETNIRGPAKKSKTLSGEVTKKKDEGIKKYAITLTTPCKVCDDLDENLQKIIVSDQFKIQKYIIGRELTKEGRPHYHLYVESKRNIYISDVKKLLKSNDRIEVKLLRTGLDRTKWINYVKKGEKEKKAEDLDYFTKLGKKLVEEISI